MPEFRRINLGKPDLQAFVPYLDRDCVAVIDPRDDPTDTGLPEYLPQWAELKALCFELGDRVRGCPPLATDTKTITAIRALRMVYLPATK